MKRGDAFYFFDEIHLWIVLSDPTPNGDAVIVSITTKEPYKDSTCEIKGGEHPRITHDSLVYFRKARLFPVSKLDEMIRLKQIKVVQPFSAELMEEFTMVQV